MNQVQINPTKLSILSINRSKYWIFKSAILEFLHSEANRNSKEEEIYSSEDEIDSLNDKFSYLNRSKRNSLYESSSSSSYSPRGRKKHGSVSSTSSFNEKEIDNSSKDDSKDDSKDKEDSFDEYEEDDDNNYFFHIAFTPIECTIICSTKIMNQLFSKPLKLCESLGYDDIKLVEEKFVNLQIDSGGNDNNRIIQLTKPLSENNISLFFLSSHFSDIVLIPHHLEEKVINILTQNHFEFNDISGSYIINNFNKEETTQSGIDLVEKTFKLFKDSNIRPIINKDISLLLTGSRSNDVTTTILKTATNISKDNIPNYFAITRTSYNEISLILPKSSKTRSKLGFQSKFLIGSTQDIINPITIDLQKLPLDSTGIVAGMASMIINGVNSFPIDYPFELNYLSMARSAILMIPKENIDLVDEILNIDYNQFST
ncbi:hypothetical protein CLIB1444_01S08460 [[Candida] jaroonii]|uniref:Uncharacterized protein n=1 Tax=[Candida] jaroonii TaxID=467808 RepID=A0ACA9Y0P9_9ASCO|nr:hypothetical protein CLIB1444_01S08460 [[Candida] jaroonii]